MHAQAIVQRFMQQPALERMHAARRTLLGASVQAVMNGHALSLSRLGRGLSGSGTHKAGLKRADRLIGSERVQSESELLAQALIEALYRCAGGSDTPAPLLMIVDWSSVAPGGEFAELRASVAVLAMGRAVTLYQIVVEQARQGNARVEKAFLERLHSWLGAWPGGVIVITDAGFRRGWFAQVQALGWSWIGRIRGRMDLAEEKERSFYRATHWMEQANGRPARACAQGLLGQTESLACALVRYRQPQRKRVGYARANASSLIKSRAQNARKAATEPWLLAHSCDLNSLAAARIVAMYRQRMQIEEAFRDTKCASLGMGLEIARSRSALRLQALLMIATVAAFLLWHIGQLAEAEGLQRRFRTTTRTARELSIIRLGLLVCQSAFLTLTQPALGALYQRIGVTP